MQLKLSKILRVALKAESRQFRHASWSCAELPQRSIIRVSGADSADFLQGLMTNDIERMVAEKWRSLYCMFLDTKGRVLFDALVYQGQLETDFLLDVDKKVAKEAAKRMALYKLRKKVSIDILQSMKVYAAYDDKDLGSPPGPCNDGVPWGDKEGPFCQDDSVQCFPDPRLKALGSRLILDTVQSWDIRKHIPEVTNITDDHDYDHHRCVLGVAEGVEEVGRGKVTPLEYNLDLLHGVNFHKGCYIGQELTARTHHTGVIRKRILPLEFSDFIETEYGPEQDIDIKNEKRKPVGKAKRLHGKVGLGLMRLKETFEAEKLYVNNSDFEVSVRKPAWWPVDLK